jgi:aspartyl-tRNA(Asn)/glutamyl-tRNA(Gln) amidotransferase subunit B
MRYRPTIGLEVHIELKTKSKMFCSCKNDSTEKRPNVNICPVCLGHPGTLPVINSEAVRKTIKTGLALNCKIPQYSKFDRKNYFYPDLPKGYQISQYDAPLCKDGYLEIDKKKIRITRIHLEEDTGRLFHEKDSSLVDFNRAGIPLMELVTEPDINSAKEARKFTQELQLILRYLDVSDADMEKGQMRIEANISLSKDKKLGTKVEVKNLNSFRSVEQAIEYEIERQNKILKNKKKVLQETRGWEDTKKITFPQREKESAHDYRYFPEPDLPPFYWNSEAILEIKKEIPELPSQKRERFKNEYGLNDEEIYIFLQNKNLSHYYEAAASELINWVKEMEVKSKITKQEFFKLTKLLSNYLTSDLQGLLKDTFILDKNFKITPENFAEFITLIYRGQISSKIAKQILKEMFLTGADPHHLIEERGLSQITNKEKIREVIQNIISQNPKAVEDFKKGKENTLQFLIGKVMAETKGRTNPQLVRELLRVELIKLKKN